MSGPDLIIESVTVLDGTGKPASGPADLLIRGGLIAEITPPAGPSSRPGLRLEGRGKWLIPGLWDTHSHTTFPAGGMMSEREFHADRAEETLRADLRNGVTTVADMGGSRQVLLRLRERQRNGEIDGARLLVTGGTFTAPGGHPAITFFGGDPEGDATRQVANSTAARSAVARLVEDDGVDAIKVVYSGGHGAWAGIPRLRRDVLEAVIDESRRRGVHVIVHCDEADEALDILSLGPDALEHMFHPRNGGLEADVARLVDLALGAGTIWSPTLVHFESLSRAGDPGYLREYDTRGSVPGWIVESLIDPKSFWMTIDEKTRSAHRNCLLAGLACLGDVHAAGVPLAVGTDSGASGVFHGLSTHREMHLLVKAGIPPLQVLAAATGVAARKFGLADRIGTIEPGKLADLVLLDADPLADFRKLQISAVILGGRIFRPDEIRVG